MDASANGFVESQSVGAKLYGPTTLANQRHFQTLIFERISPSQLIEEEYLPYYLAERYCPSLVRIGNLLESRYQILRKRLSF